MTILQNDAKSFVALFCYFLFFEYFCFFDLCHSFLLSCTLVKWSLVQHTRTDWCGRCEKATLALTGNRSPCLILLPPSLLVPLCILHHKSAVAASLFIWSQLKNFIPSVPLFCSSFLTRSIQWAPMFALEELWWALPSLKDFCKDMFCDYCCHCYRNASKFLHCSGDHIFMSSHLLLSSPYW